MKAKVPICLLLLLLASFFLLKPLLAPGFFVSDDGEWMVIRLSAFFQAFRDGQFPVRFLTRLNHGYGYPVANFLYPGFLYAGSLIHALSFSFVDSVKIILAGSVIAASSFIFLWLRRFFSTFASFLGALSFLFAPYMAFDLYVRGSVGEVFALAPATAGFFAIASGRIWLLAPSIGLLLIAHNSLALLFLPYLILYALANPRPNQFAAFLLGIGGSAFFWLPALVEKQYVRFDETVVSRYGEYFLKGDQLVLLGPLFLFVFAAWFLSKKRYSNNLLHILVFAASSIFAISASEPIWRILPIAQYFQFPYRFLAVGMVSGAFIVSNFVQYQKRKAQIIFAGVALVVFATTLAPRIVSVSPVFRERGFYETNEATTTVANEYLPRWVSVPPVQHTLRKISVVSGLGTATLLRSSSKRFEAEVVSQSKGTVQLSIIYYPGWGVLVDDVPVPVRFTNERGLIEFDVPAGKHRIVAVFHETPLRLLADALSAASIVGYLFFIIRHETPLTV